MVTGAAAEVIDGEGLQKAVVTWDSGRSLMFKGELKFGILFFVEFFFQVTS